MTDLLLFMAQLTRHARKCSRRLRRPQETASKTIAFGPQEAFTSYKRYPSAPMIRKLLLIKLYLTQTDKHRFLIKIGLDVMQLRMKFQVLFSRIAITLISRVELVVLVQLLNLRFKKRGARASPFDLGRRQAQKPVGVARYPI